MFASGTGTAARRVSRSRSKSAKRTRSPKAIGGSTEGYTCTLYQDYLVFYGGKNGHRVIGDVCVYNLKEKRFERNSGYEKQRKVPKYSHSACFYDGQGSDMILFYGGESDPAYGQMKKEAWSENPVLVMNFREGGEVQWLMDHGVSGQDMPSPISNAVGEKLYLYQPEKANGNFGSLHIYHIQSGKFETLQGVNDNQRLSLPSDAAIFCDNNLYLFVENEESPRKRGTSNKIFEDVYVLDLADEENEKRRWRKVSPGGQAPGLLTNVSMAATNGIIYVFGMKIDELGGESKSVLWAYDTNGEVWNEVKEIGTLTADTNQRAVIYKNQLLIIDWSHPNQLVNIQYQNLNNLSFAVSSSTKKQICRDQPDSFIQHSKNLYNGRLFADITFEVEGEEIPAHKAILAYRSSYFMKMFTSGMSESHSTRISIPNIKSHIFKALLQYIYCNEIELDEQLALDLIPVVDEYLMQGLKGLCEKYLCKQLRKDNVVDMLIVADRHEIEELKKACFRFILKNLGNIDENEEMMKLSKTLFIELLKFNTSSGSQSSNKKNEEEEEEKSNYYGGYGTAKASAKKSTGMPSQGFGFNSFGETPSYGFGAQADTRKRSKSRSKSKPRKKEKSPARTTTKWG